MVKEIHLADVFYTTGNALWQPPVHLTCDRAAAVRTQNHTAVKKHFLKPMNYLKLICFFI